MEKTQVIKISNLTIEVSGNTLIKNQSLDIYDGEIILLIGGSGSGKSVFMKVLTGLIDHNSSNVSIQGAIEIEGRDYLSNSYVFRKKNPIGIVFQDGALFDRYTIDQNLDFAFNHSPHKISKEEKLNLKLNLLKELEIDASTSIRYASGGQKKRIAIARTLAYNPNIVIYDEPTAGLDPYSSKKAANLIKSTHKLFKKSCSIIVTHQYEDFLPFVDRILLLDSQNKKIVEIPMHQFEALIQDDIFKSEIKSDELHTHILKRITKNTANILEKTTFLFLLSLKLIISSLFRTIPLWKSQKWGLRFLFHYIKLTSFLSSVIYVSMASIIIGFVGSYFTFKYLPYSYYTKPLITEEVLGVLGFALFRIVIPLIIAILLAARSGAAVASDIGNRVYLQELDAISSLGGSPKSYIHTNVIYSYILSVPLLTLMGFYLSKAVCIAVFLYLHPSFNLIWADSIFNMYLNDTTSSFLIGADWLIFKQVVSGWGLANIVYFIGSRPKYTSSDISKDITMSIILGTLFVLITHMVFALFEFDSIVF
ncbi:ATP-binding cassette domain-containing protein [Myxococcota bacterium]|nr:ATP-binding cassette domain-containing protein [Myxococcota bacterium]